MVSIFGIKFFISFLGNILILLFLIPLFILIVGFLFLNSYSSKINKCSSCGTISLGLSKTCLNCGANLEDSYEGIQFNEKPSESTIEIKAEEIE